MKQYIHTITYNIIISILKFALNFKQEFDAKVLSK